MALYKIHWKRSAHKDLKSIDRQMLPRILETVDSLAQNPFPPNHRKLTGSEASYRIRIGDYRVVYQVEPATRDVVIYHVRHRKDVYKKM